MKKTNFFLIIFTLIVGACKHENVTPSTNPAKNAKDLIGEWIWVQSSGGIAGITQTPDNQNTTRRYLFTANSLEVTEVDKQLGKVSYTTENGKTLLFNALQDIINLKTEDCKDCKLMSKYVFHFNAAKDSLFLQEDVNDGFEHIYVKKRSDGFQEATYTGIDPKLCPSPCCGGFLLNIEGKTYQTPAFPAGFVMDYKKTPQKLLVKISPTVHSCTPIVVNVTEAKLK